MRTWTIAFALILTACGAMLTGSKAFFEDQKPPLTKTASFDLGCPADQLSYTPLGHESDGYDKVGVSGCTKKVTYSFHADGGWTKDSETTGAQ